MADDKIDDILVRLDEIEKLQTELRHLVPRVTSSSSSRHHQDTLRDSSASIRFPSLFTFPMISNFASSPKTTERVQKSTAQINLNKWSTSGNRTSTTNLTKAAGRSFSKSALATRGASVSGESLRGNNVAKLRGLSRNSAISSSAASSTVRNDDANKADRNAQKAIKKYPKKSEAAKITIRNKTQLRENENSFCCSVQTSASRVRAAKTTANSADARSYLRDSCRPDQRISTAREKLETRTFVERVMDKLNYCFVNNKKVTVPCHHPGSWTPRRVQMSPSPIIGATDNYPRMMRVSSAKISVN